MKPTIYVSSKHTHIELWRYHRLHGHNIISSWIDLDGVFDAETIGKEYWPVWLAEAASADYLIFYAVPADRHQHQSCLLEIAACLAAGGIILHVGVSDMTKTLNGELADFTYHPRWHRIAGLDRALDIAANRVEIPAPPAA